jgi:cyclopropane fatty-acyl-phospholipid synthase-like methyltransferase
MYTPGEVAEYYNTTQNHYRRWWNLKEGLSLHYGICDENARSFAESLVNTNRIMMQTAGVSANDKVLDAGCGVGGAAIYLARMKNAEVTGISLSDRQIECAREHARHLPAGTKISFHVMDFTRTSFPDESFDVVWACESVCQADKQAFINESFRLLRKGGRLIMADFFLTSEDQIDRHLWIRKWCDTWAVTELVSCDRFAKNLHEGGYKEIKTFDFTANIRKSSQRMYIASLLGAIPSEVYNLFHPKVNSFAKRHYRCGYYQFRALQEGLWRYNIISAQKSDADGVVV